MEQSGLLSELNPDALSEKMEELFPQFTIDFSGFLSRLLAGEMKEAFSLLFSSLKGGVAAEAAGMRNLFLTLLMIGVLSSLFTVAAQAFKNRQTADIAHFIACLTVLLTVLSVYSRAAGTVGTLLENILLFVRLFLPTFMLALGFSAGTVTAAGYYELILLLIYGVEQLLMSVGLPAADICMALVVMNGVWEEGKLSPLIDLIRKGAAGGLKFLLGCITGIGLLQSMVTPVLESLKISSATKFLSSIPGLGGLAEGTAQLLIGSAVLIKNGLGAAAILRQTESPWVVFLVSALFCAFVLSVVFHRSADPGQAAQILEATITCAGNSVTVPLLQDTGNTLRDPESGQIVCIVWDRALQPLGVQAYRKIPFQSLGQPGGELDCFTCDSLTIGSKTWRNYPVGVSLHPLGGGGYVGLWGGEMEGANDHVEKTAQPLGPSGNLASRRRALHRRQRYPAPAPAPGGGDGAVGTAGGRGLGGPPAAHRAEPPPGGVHRPAV